MKTEIRYFHVETSEASFTFIGGQTKSGSPGKVWLTTPTGEPVLEVPADCVKTTSREETAHRIEANWRATKAPLN